MLEGNKIYNMDCLEGIKLLDDNSVDSIVTDPPYELGFMGKKWDSTGIAYNVELWEECLRVLKPGGHLLAFGGTRTYHRMACAIEDAGFEIRDCIQWIYGSGFPKSLSVSKAIDKKLGAERKVVGTKSGDPKRFKKWKEGDGNKRTTFNNYITAPATPEAQQWEGWGTCLKPANEPIVLARKPLSEKTIADNVLKWGTGGINIDGCRIGTEQIKTHGKRQGKGVSLEWSKYTSPEGYEGGTHQGRFPANVILDEEAGLMLDEQSGISRSSGGSGAKSLGGLGKNVYGKYALDRHGANAGGLGDVGGASRFFKNIDYTREDYEEPTRFKYCAKASKKERGEGNNHPTVKPIKLMEYLITLITPPNGIVLDPFMGSGTTAIACKQLGFDYIGFEKEKSYSKIIEGRVGEHPVTIEDKPSKKLKEDWLDDILAL